MLPVVPVLRYFSEIEPIARRRQLGARSATYVRPRAMRKRNPPAADDVAAAATASPFAEYQHIQNAMDQGHDNQRGCALSPDWVYSHNSVANRGL